MKFITLPLIAGTVLLGLGACSTFQQEGQTGSSATKVQVQESAAVDASAPRTRSTSAPKGMVIARAAFPTGDVATSSLLVEKVIPQMAQLGSEFTYETHVTNVTSFTLDNVVLSETRDSNFVLNSSEPKATKTSAESTEWNLGNMAPNATRTIRVSGKAKSENSINNCVSVSFSSALCSSIPVTSPQLLLVASGPKEIIQCDKLEYTYVVSNPGSGSATGVVVNGTLPAGMTVNGKSSFSRTLKNLLPGKSSQFKVVATPGRTGSFEHLVTATADGNLKASSKSVITMVKKPKLQITMAGPETRLAGRDTTYQITVKNIGDGVARDMLVQTNVPTSTEVKSSSKGSKLSPGKLTWNLADLAAGQETKLSLKLNTTQIGQLSMKATANAFCADAVSSKVNTVLKGIPAILLEVIDIEDPIEVGANLTYVVSVTNQGTAAATNVNIAISLPANVSFVKATGTTRPVSAVSSTGQLRLTPVASLAPKAQAVWRIEVKGNSEADARFKVSMTSDQLTSPVEESEATTYYK